MSSGQTDPIEIVFYIHGVSPARRGRPHTGEYEELHHGIGEHLAAWPTRFGGAEWGWNADGGPADSQELLTDAQRLLGSRLLPVVNQARDFTLNPARAALSVFRDLFFYNFADMFYYVSEDGKLAVRLAVARQILAHIAESQGGDQERPVSLTLMGHSAGSVVAFDFLFALFQPQHRFIHSNAAAARAVKDDLKRMQAMVQAGRLRVRRLVTFGSPIASLAFRSDAVLKILASDRCLDPTDYGLDHDPPGFSTLSGPRWINLWDKDDTIAFPVEPLMDQHVGDASGSLVEDVYVDVSDSIVGAHNAYWSSSRVHREVAARW